MDLEIYTDGSCHNRGEGILSPMGCGVIINGVPSPDMGPGFPRLEYYLSLENGTSNRAELLAIISALQVVGPREDSVKVFTDSRYCIGQAKGHFRVNRNKDLVFTLRNLAAQFPNIDFLWVPGHKEIWDNVRADELATWGRTYHVEALRPVSFFHARVRTEELQVNTNKLLPVIDDPS